MKNTTKTIAAVFAVFLVAALFVGAASAADRTITSAGSDAFVYENITINATGIVVDTKLVKYTDGQNPTAVNQISGTKEGNNATFYLTSEAVNGQYGAYYFNGTPTTGNKNITYIWYPELTIQAELTNPVSTWGSTSGDSIDGKTINKDSNVTFLINTPKVGPANVSGAFTDLKVKIVFTTPVGGKTTYFGKSVPNNYSAIAVTKAQNIAGSGVPGNDAAAGTWTAQAEFTTYKPFENNAKKSNTISYTVQSSTLTITAAKDSVVRSNPLTVTISGESLQKYNVTIKNAIVADNNPTIQEGQSGFQNIYFYPSDDSSKKQKVGGQFKTDASGKRTVQYNTAENTEDKTYTIRVEKDKDSTDYDEVKVKVEKGTVTISASGDGSYYIGSEIKLTGTNTDSSNVFLFITGPNLAANGLSVKNLNVNAERNFNPVPVKTDNTWEYKWNTESSFLDTGAYTIYATSRLTNGKSSQDYLLNLTSAATTEEKKYGTEKTVNTKTGYYAVKLSDSEYATVSVNLKQPFLSAVPSGTVVAKGDKIYIRGTAEGEPSKLQLYIFGPNKFVYDSITVETDGSYEKKLEIGSDWSSSQYYVVVEHPMYNDKIDVKYSNGETQDQFFGLNKVLYIMNTGNNSVQSSFIVEGTGKLQGSNAADALTKMIDSPNIDDIYTKLTFTVAEPMISVKNPGDQAVGSKFTISGTTNLAVDDQILVEVMSSSFSAVDKTSTDITSGVSRTTKVVAGEGTDNTWSVEIDTTNWKLDEYTIKVAGIEVDVTITTNFNLVEKPVTTTPTTAVPTGATPTATTAKPTETPKTPGFGAFIALAGLGAVALLVLRRN